MGYDIFFCRVKRGVRLSLADIIEALTTKKELTGVVAIAYAKVKNAFQNEYPDLIEDNKVLIWKGKETYFRVSFMFTEDGRVKLILASCDLNPLLNNIQIFEHLASAAEKLKCSIFDPQMPSFPSVE